MAERRARGVFDTSAVIDLPVIERGRATDPGLDHGGDAGRVVAGAALAAGPPERSVRLERLQVVEADFPAPLPFDAAAARRHGSLVALEIVSA